MKRIITMMTLLLLCLLLVFCACCNEEKNLEFDYQIDNQVYHPGDKVKVTVMVKNVGKDFRYNGSILDRFSNGVLALDGGDYQIETNDDDVVTADIAEHKFLKNSTETYVYFFTLPENTPEGDYSLSFSIFGVGAEFDKVILVLK